MASALMINLARFFLRGKHSLKLTKWMVGGWNTIVSFWCPANFSGPLLFVSGRVISPQVIGSILTSTFQKSSQGLVRLIKFPTKNTTNEITQWELACSISPLF